MPTPAPGPAPAREPHLSAPLAAATSRVIVQARGAASGAGAAVVRLGGTVTRDLPVVDGVAATVPTAALAALSSRPGLIVTPDSTVTVQGTVSSSAATTSVYREVVGADDLNTEGYLGAGVTVAIYGTGYSSLSYLRRLPVDEMKIDKSFVMSMNSEDDDDVIVRSTVDLGHNLGLRVVAEGVEDAASWARLAALGCDSAQGFWLSRPIPADEVAPLIARLDAERDEAESAVAS